MVTDRSDYDVVVVGASIAGCATATLLGRAGARVALVERRADPAAFKRVCGHFIQSSGVPVLERLGVLDEALAAGAVQGRPRIWSRYGWFTDGDGDAPPSLSLRREILDPLLRRTAAETDGVDVLLGHALDTVGRWDGERRAIRVTSREAGARELTGRLVVGADGRGSRTAELAGLRTRTSRNGRFGYWGYFEGPGLQTDAAVHLWFLEPDVAIATPTDGGLMLYAAFPDVARIPEFKRDPEAALRAFVARVPDAPPIEASRRVGPMVGRLDLTNEWRRTTGPGIALVGDAALAADPVGAIGCGWALQSAGWLADALAPALTGEQPVDRALRRYRRRHRQGLLGHSLVAAAGARERSLSPPQRLLFSAAVADPRTAAHVEAFASRRIGPRRFLAPGPLARAARVNLRERRTARDRAPVPTAT